MRPTVTPAMTPALVSVLASTVEAGPGTGRLIADTIACPVCGSQATVEWRTDVDDFVGPVERMNIACPGEHPFSVPA